MLKWKFCGSLKFRDYENLRVQLLTSNLYIFKDTINAVYADGLKFSHPLNHLGKSANDLPLLAIDSFRHMYLFPKTFKDIGSDQILLKFVTDLHSGKLHREFHNGPDPTEAPAQPIVI